MSRDSEPPQWEDLTPREIGALTKGCGSAAFDAPELWFHDACRHHDFLYWRGGGPSDRAAADIAFYAAMAAVASTASNPLSRTWRRLWAWIYFKAVRIFGASNFSPVPKTWKDVVTTTEAFYRLHPELDPERQTRVITRPRS